MEMGFQRLKISAKNGLRLGLVLLIVGIAVFMYADAGTKLEKIGFVFMTYGAMAIGMGYTALVALNTSK